MRKFTKSILALAMLFVAVGANAKTEKVHATFESPSNTNTTWTPDGTGTTKGTFTWSTTYYNQLKNIGLPNGDITGYKKLVVDCKINSGEKFRILFYKGGSNLTLWAEDGVNEFIIKDELEAIAPNDYNEYMLACDEICLSGSGAVAPGEAVINDVYLETYDDEGEKVYATFESPSNTNTTWTPDGTGTTKGTFTWSTTYYNQLKNIGLPNGDITGYKKLVVDCKINSGEKFRILFYKGGSNLTLWAEDGVNEFIIKDELEAIAPNDYNEYILACDEICLSGSGAIAPGEVIINSVYLETYPENEQVDIPEIQYEEDPGRPVGDYIDLTTAFPSLQPRIGIGQDSHPIVLGNGEVIVGARSKNVIADLSPYSKMTLVTSPNLKVVIYMNHEVDAQQNAGDYDEGDAGKYVFLNTQADENGIIEVDLTAYDKQDLNCICLPWDNSNKGTVWYILLTEATGANVTIGSSGYATFSSTKAVTIPDGVEAYAAKVQDNKVVLTKVDAVPANTAVILKATAGNYSLPYAENAAAIAENDLLVSNGTVAGDGTIYVLADGTKGVGFYKLADGEKVPAGKAYLKITSTAREFIGFDGATGIETVKTAKAEEGIFNLQGQRLMKAQKGLNIINGKKFLVK